MIGAVRKWIRGMERTPRASVRAREGSVIVGKVMMCLIDFEERSPALQERHSIAENSIRRPICRADSPAYFPA
jgi:hypothetical protein